MERKYTHHLSYMAKNNTVGCIVIYNNLKKYRTDLQVKGLTDFIEEQNPNLQNVIITNLLSFKKLTPTQDK